MKKLFFGISLALFLGLMVPAMAQDAAQPFVGCWALSLPNNGAGWLEVAQKDGHLAGSLLWYGGSVNPLDTVTMEGNTLHATRVSESEMKDAAGKVTMKIRNTDTVTCTVSGDAITGSLVASKKDKPGPAQAFTGKRIPPVPPAPDRTKAKLGAPITLLNGKDLSGWKLTDPKAVSGWRIENGILMNNPAQKEGQPHISYGNLRTEQEFEDFNLKLEVNVPPKGNSGIYLRGIYEVQVQDNFGQPLDSHNMGGIYSRIAPSESAEKPARRMANHGHHAARSSRDRDS